MACKPATPAPMTNTLAALSVPAAVISMGKIFGSAVGRQEHCAIAGNRRLRGEHVHRLGTGDPRQQFQSEERGAGRGNLLIRLRLAQRVAEADDDFSRGQSPQVVLALLRIGPAGTDLEDHVGGKDFVAGRYDRGAFVQIKRIGKAGRRARTGLHMDFDPSLC